MKKLIEIDWRETKTDPPPFNVFLLGAWKHEDWWYYTTCWIDKNEDGDDQFYRWAIIDNRVGRMAFKKPTLWTLDQLLVNKPVVG